MARHETNDENRLAPTLVGVGLGSLIGIGLGCSAGSTVFPWYSIVVGATVGATVCGSLGFWLGSGFTEWLKEHWLWWT